MDNTKHWTGESDSAMIYKLGFDFVAQLEKHMQGSGITQAKLAKALGVSEGAVSKMINNPQNLTLRTIAKYSKALGIKAAIVAYDDGDRSNAKSLVSPEIFNVCWERAGKPRDMWSLPSASNGPLSALWTSGMLVQHTSVNSRFISDHFSQSSYSSTSPMISPPVNALENLHA
jgi:transcriptional regulator with XRE-family HTH domain